MTNMRYAGGSKSTTAGKKVTKVGKELLEQLKTMLLFCLIQITQLTGNGENGSSVWRWGGWMRMRRLEVVRDSAPHSVLSRLELDQPVQMPHVHYFARHYSANLKSSNTVSICVPIGPIFSQIDLVRSVWWLASQAECIWCRMCELLPADGNGWRWTLVWSSCIFVSLFVYPYTHWYSCLNHLNRFAKHFSYLII